MCSGVTEAGCARACRARGGGLEKGSATYISQLPSQRIRLGWSLWDPGSPPSLLGGEGSRAPYLTGCLNVLCP